MSTPIPTADAIRLCQEVSAQNMAHRWNPLNWQCWGCLRFSKSAEERCFAGPDNRGCGFVNKAWDAEAKRLQ